LSVTKVTSTLEIVLYTRHKVKHISSRFTYFPGFCIGGGK
jgi:hypothetical protein